MFNTRFEVSLTVIFNFGYRAATDNYRCEERNLFVLWDFRR